MTMLFSPNHDSRDTLTGDFRLIFAAIIDAVRAVVAPANPVPCPGCPR